MPITTSITKFSKNCHKGQYKPQGSRIDPEGACQFYKDLYEKKKEEYEEQVYTIDVFLDKLEIVLDLKDAGYVACLDKVKELVNTKTNKQLHGYKKGYERVKKQKETILKLYEEQRAINKKLTEQLEQVRKKGLEYKNKWCETINIDIELSNEKAKNKKLTEENKELKAELEQEKNKAIVNNMKVKIELDELKAKLSSMIIPDRDKRISPIDMKMSYGYVRDWIEQTQIGDAIAEKWWDTDKCEEVMEDIAQAIENEITAYITAYEHNDLKQIVCDRVFDVLVSSDKVELEHYD